MDEARARELLAAERAALEDQLARAGEELGESERERAGELADVDQHPADVASETNDRTRAVGRVEELRDRIAAVERAERRLAAGTYGVSVQSGEPIPDERLEALPAAELTTEEEAGREALDRAPEPTAEGDDTTPLDRVEPPPPDLADIPMRSGDGAGGTPDDDLTESLDAPGEVYADGRSIPQVGEEDPEDRDLAGRYRPK